MKMDKNEIVIKIEEGIQTKAFNVENIIHKDAFNRVVDLINQNLDKAKNYNPHNKEDLINNRIHNTITINGERGAGKTSFMLSIKKEYENSNEVEILGILDPTLISTKQHVFILLISMIEEKVYEKFNDKCRGKKYDDKFKKWKESLEELAKGLNQLDGVGSNPYAQDLWDDSALVMAKGLSMAKAGRNLEWKFHKFVYESLEILSDKDNKKNAFLLFIDDIDTDFSKGWDVLEVLRKYITTPQIIPIMAGNFELYENLVRNKKSKLFTNLVEFYNNLNKYLNKSYIERLNNYENQLNELTQQYLMKVIQPINMINLHKLYYYLIYKKKNIFVEDKNKKIQLKQFIENIFNTFYKINYPEYINIITKLPLRTIFQWLYFAKLYIKNENTRAFLEANKDIFIDNFFNLGITNEFFEIIKTDYVLDEFTNKFINLITFEDIKEFKPNYINTDLNLALIIVPQFLNLQDYLYNKLEYGIKVSLQFYLLDKLLILKNNQNFQDNVNLLAINKYLLLHNRLKNSLKIIINQGLKTNLAIQIYKNKNKINIKVLRKYIKQKFNDSKKEELLEIIDKYEENIKALKSKEKISKNIKLELNNMAKYLDDSIKNNIETIKAKLFDVNELTNFKDKLPIFGVKNIKGTQVDYFVSPLKIIALFIDVLSCFENYEKKHTPNTKVKNDEQKDILNIKTEIKNKLYIYLNDTNWIIISDLLSDEEETENEDETLEINGDSFNDFIEEIIYWYQENSDILDEFRKKFHIIESSKFFYNFYKKIETLKKSCCITVSDYIKVTLSIFINELVSLYLLDKKEKTIKQISSIKSLKELDYNLDKLYNDKKKCIIGIFYNCPIFNSYLREKESNLDKIILIQG